MDLEPASNEPEQLANGALVLDSDRYLPMVAGEFATEEEASAFLAVLSSIMCSMVDLGWGVDSIHFAFPELAEISSPDSEGTISSLEHPTIKQQAEAAFAKPPSSGDS